MKIVIDATSLLLPSAGVRNYVQYWLLSLLELSSAKERITTHPFGVPVPLKLDHEHSVAGSFTTRLRLDLVTFLNIRGNPAIDLAVLGADLFHASQHAKTVPRLPKVTATVFDFSCWVTPQFHKAANIAATRMYGESVLRSADGLIAISEHARRDAIEVLGVPGERIRVVYPGVAEAFFSVTRELSRQTMAKYRLDGPYLLFVGCIEPRKNVRAIVQAYERLSDSLRREVRLILAGPFGWEGDELRNMLARERPNVRYLGYVPEVDLPGLVGGATALVYPSFYEGFGLPAAQAMAAAVPVIASNRSCLPEVVGDGGVLVNPDSVEEISTAMDVLCTQPDVAERLGRCGRTRALKFRWPVCAAASMEFFRDVASGRPALYRKKASG